MKIISVNVTAFGKLKNFTHNFDGNTELFNNVNGFGKSTLAGFIRAMFYGLQNSTKEVKSGDNTTQRYRPWNSNDSFGGSLIFSHEGKTYKIERYFGKGRSEEKHITCVESGKTLDIDNYGEFFFGLMAESFDRSVFIPQESVEISSNDNFNKKLSGIVEDNVDTEKVIAELTRYRKTFKNDAGGRNAGGVIVELENQIDTLEHQLVSAKRSEEEKDECERNCKKLQKSISDNRQTALQLSEKLGELQERKAQCNNSQNNEIDKRRMQLAEEMGAYPSNLQQRYNDACGIMKDIDDLQKAEPNKDGKKHILIFCLILSLVIGIVVAIFNVAIGIVLGIVGVAISLVLYFFTNLGVKKVDNSNNIANLQMLFNQCAVPYGTSDNMQSAIDNLLVALQKRNELENKLDALNSIVTVTKVFADEQLLQQTESDYKRILQKNVDDEKELSKLEERLRNFNFEPSVVVQDKLEQCKTKLVEAQQTNEVILKTIELIAQAKENLASSYLPKLTKRASELISQVLQQDCELTTDKDFNEISITLGNVTRSIAVQSRGIREIALLCFRVALSELLSGGIVPVLIVDDAFVNYDESNFARAISLLKTLSEKGTQIIYFTCHDRGNLLLK